EPAAVPDVRRPEEAVGVRGDEKLLVPGRRRAPDREAPVAVMVVEQHEEAFLVTHEEARRPVAQPLARLRKPETDPPEPLEGRLPLCLARVRHNYGSVPPPK